MSEADRRGAETRLVARAVILARTDPDAELVVDTEFPGYLRRTVEDRQVFVPAHLAPVFPGIPLLADVVQSAICLSLAYGHPICLSGSTTFLGRSKSVSDLDFCEYFLTNERTIPGLVEAKLQGTGRGPLVRFKCQNSTLQAPWDQFAMSASALLFSSSSELPAHRFKLDFVQRTEQLGLIPSTSVVLPISPKAPEGMNAEFSFVYQEAVITTGRPPRTLLSAERLARYLLWLRADVRRWLDPSQTNKVIDAPLKALKRTLSLLLTVGRADLVEPCVDVLSSQEITDVSMKARVSDLESMISVAAPGLKLELQDDLDRMLKNLIHPLPTDSQCIEAMEGAREEAEDLMSDIDAMFEAAA